MHKHESLHTKAPLKYFSKEDHVVETQISYHNKYYNQHLIYVVFDICL